MNYLFAERPNGVFLGAMINKDNQEDCFDILKNQYERFMRIQICSELLRHVANICGREEFRHMNRFKTF